MSGSIIWCQSHLHFPRTEWNAKKIKVFGAARDCFPWVHLSWNCFHCTVLLTKIKLAIVTQLIFWRTVSCREYTYQCTSNLVSTPVLTVYIMSTSKIEFVLWMKPLGWQNNEDYADLSWPVFFRCKQKVNAKASPVSVATANEKVVRMSHFEISGHCCANSV